MNQPTYQPTDSHIIVTDQYADEHMSLKVYHFDDFTQNRELQQIRGYVVDQNDNNTIVCKTFGYTPEVLANNHQQLNDEIGPLISGETSFFKAYEGTLLRVWCYKNKWFLSTHRKLDAFKSRWGSSTSYGDLFCAGLSNRVDVNGNTIPTSFNEFVATLNSDKVYVFLMKSCKINRKVCRGDDKPVIYVVGAFIRSQNFAFTSSNEETNCSQPERLAFASADELVDFVLQSDPHEIQGVVLNNPNGSMGKLVNPMYDHFDKIRGNVPNVLHRYVQLRWKPECTALKQMYPEHVDKFDEWEAVMKQVVDNVLRKYFDRYIHHNTAIVPSEQYPLMQQVHQYYIQKLRASHARIQPEHVWEILGGWQERDVNVLYKEFKRRQRMNGDGNYVHENMVLGITTSMTNRKIFETF
jgi:hypothetical protein